MTVRVTDDDLVERVRRVEATTRDAVYDGTGPCSIAAQRTLFDAWARDAAEADVALSDLASETVGDPIYGSGGIHRYFVRGDGRVVFSRRHASAEAVARATAEGFDLH